MKHLNIYPNVKLKDESLSKNAQMAFCLAKSMIPELDNFIDFKESKWNDILNVKDEIAKLDGKIEKCKQNITAERQKITDIRPQINELKGQIRYEITLPWKFILIRWLWFLFKGKKWKEKFYLLRNELNEKKIAVNSYKDEIKNLENEIQGLHDNILTKEDEIKKRETELESLPEVPQIVSGLGEINIPIFPIKIKDRQFKQDDETIDQEIYTFIDLFSKMKKLDIPKLDIDLDEVISELNFIESFRTDDILIAPDEDEKGKWGDPDELIGKEKKLYNSIKILKEMIQKMEIINTGLPIIDNDDPLSAVLQESIDTVETGDYVPSSAMLDENLLEAYESFGESEKLVSKFLNEEFQNIINIDNKINIIKDEIGEIHQKTTILRKESSEFLSDYLNGMSYYSDLVSNHYFCPKCNVTPKYMNEKMGLEFEDVGDFEKLTTEELSGICFNFLKAEIFTDNLGSKMSKDEKDNIIQSWELAFDNLYRIEREVNTLSNQLRSSGSNVFKLAMLREIKTKRNLYRIIVKDLLKNHRSEWKMDNANVEPGEDMSLDLFKNSKEYYNRNTKLKYKISDGIWICPFCNSEFNYEEAKLGSTHKIEYDLELPVLNTLWNDEKVWSKLLDLHKDISREHRDRLEQESVSIQGRIDQFLSDSRQIRQTIQGKFSQSSAAIKRVQNIESKFSKFNLLDSKTIDELHRIATQNAAKLQQAEALIGEMSNKENDLNELPKQIAFETQLAIKDHINNKIKQIRLDK